MALSQQVQHYTDRLLFNQSETGTLIVQENAVRKDFFHHRPALQGIAFTVFLQVDQDKPPARLIGIDVYIKMRRRKRAAEFK